MASFAQAWEPVNKWLATLSLAPAETIWRGIDDYLPLDPNLDHGRAQARFDSIAVVDETVTGVKEKLLKERALISLLQDSGALPHSSLGTEAGSIIFQSLSYLSSVPFPPQEAVAIETKTRGLNYHDFQRSLAWLLRGHVMGRIDIGGRARTGSDERRLFFQSLATIAPNYPANVHSLSYEEERRLAAADVESEPRSSPAFDEDGDQMFHDLLDTLHAVQPDEQPVYQPVPRDDFRIYAKKLHNKTVQLHQLAIPRKHFKTLIQALLPLQLGETVWRSDQAARLGVDDFEEAAERITAAFYQKSESAICWRAFDQAWLTVAPQLFRIYNRILCQLLLGGIIWTMQAEPDPLERFPEPGKVLDRPLLCQVGTIFSHTFAFDDLVPLRHYTPAEEAKIISVIHQFESLPPCAMLVVSGSTIAGERYVFAAFSLEPSKDGKAIVRADSSLWEGAALVQLAPVQDVFRGIVGQPGWNTSARDVCFGNVREGAAMVLTDGLRSARISHNVGDDKSRSVYKTADWRDNWAVEFEIDGVEIWGDPAP